MTGALSQPQDIWQAEWHRILDADPIGRAEGPTPDPLPHFYDDFRLHFGLWQVGAQTRAKMLSILPEADALIARCEAMLARQDPISFDQAEGLVREALTRLQHFDLPQPPVDVAIERMSLATHSYPKDMGQSDPVTLALDDLLPGPRTSDEQAQLRKAAYYFLREPFYRLISDNAAALWLAWPLCAWPNAPDVYAPLARLAAQGYVVGHSSDDHVILFDIEKDRSPA